MGPAGLLLSQLDRRCPIVAVAVALAQLIVGGRALQRARDLCQYTSRRGQARKGSVALAEHGKDFDGRWISAMHGAERRLVCGGSQGRRE